jgi:hypothetical protein
LVFAALAHVGDVATAKFADGIVLWWVEDSAESAANTTISDDCTHKHLSSTTLITECMPLFVTLFGAAASDPSPRNSVPSSLVFLLQVSQTP